MCELLKRHLNGWMKLVNDMYGAELFARDLCSFILLTQVQVANIKQLKNPET